MSETVTLSGRAIKKRFGAGSKSDRMAVFLHTDRGDYLLRRKGGLAYADPELEALVGKQLQCIGTFAGYTLLVTEYEVLD